MLSLRGGFDICKKRDHYRYWSRFFRHGWTVRSLVAVAIWVGFVSLVTGMFSGVKLLVPHVALLCGGSGGWRTCQELLLATLLDIFITVVICNCKTWMVLKTTDTAQLQGVMSQRYESSVPRTWARGECELWDVSAGRWSQVRCVKRDSLVQSAESCVWTGCHPPLQCGRSVAHLPVLLARTPPVPVWLWKFGIGVIDLACPSPCSVVVATEAAALRQRIVPVHFQQYFWIGSDVLGYAGVNTQKLLARLHMK